MSFPLLGKKREMLGDFEVNCIPRVLVKGDEKPCFIFQLNKTDVQINNEVVQGLINSEKASLVTTIFCSSTLFRQSFNGYDKIKVNPNEIGGKILVTTCIIAISNFEIDLSSNQEVNQFFRNKITVGKGKKLSVDNLRMF